MRRIPDVAPRPEPLIHPDTQLFWEGLDDGRLLVQVCGACGTHRYPFAPVCHRCHSFEHAWEPLAPEGTVAAAVRVQRATGEQVWDAHVPYLSGIVDMEHGLRLPGRILCRCGEARKRGAAVTAVALTFPDAPTVHAFAHSCVDVA